MDDLLQLRASFFPCEKKTKKKEPGTMPGAIEFVISRLADLAELAIRSRVLINNAVLLPDR